MKIHLINDGQWILGKIAEELLQINDPEITIDRSYKVDRNADINYYINWQAFVRHEKSRFDMIWFAHLAGADEIIALRKADLIVAKSGHGKQTLQSLGFHPGKIKIFKGIGAATDFFKKIKIGFAGRLYDSGRKGEDDIWRLAENLDSRIFKFIMCGTDPTIQTFTKKLKQITDAEITYDQGQFFKDIDYYIQPSKVEGGPMDIINAINTGTKIVSQDIGFFYDFKTPEDFAYNNFAQVLKYFKEIEKSKKAKLQRAEINTWENFRQWHVELFKRINS